MYSQYGQDSWVLSRINHKGFYVDVGANDGISISNTYFMEKLGWDGICVEPNPESYKLLLKNRKCICLDNCLDEDVKIIDFYYGDSKEFGCAIVGPDTDAEKNLHYENSLNRNNVIKLATTTLEIVLDKYQAPKIIDYLSLDTEGSEQRILRNFPFDKYSFRTITVERPKPELRELLDRHGYKIDNSVNSHDDVFYLGPSLV